MEDQPQGSASDLKALAEAKFGKESLSAAERLLVENAPSGEPVMCGPNYKDQDNNPSDADNWGRERQIRAALLGWLCMDQEARERVHWRGIQVYGADVTGPLGLSLVKITFQLALRHCRLETIDLTQAEVSQLDLQGSLMRGIIADRLNVKNYVLLRNGFKSKGRVWLVGAQIGADLDCSYGIFTNPPQTGVPESGIALRADAIDVKGSVSLLGSTASGQVRIAGAQIGRDLDCSGGTFTNPPQKDLPESGTALGMDRIIVKGDVFLRNGFSASGEVRLLGAQIGGDLACPGGTFTNPRQKDVPGSGDTLTTDGIEVKRSVLLRGITASGEVRLIGARIGGDLDCSEGTFTNPRQKDVPGGSAALRADGIEVKRSVFFRGSTASGELRLLGAHIGADLDCSGGTFSLQQKDSTRGGDALSADRIDVRGDVYLGDGFSSGREVRLLGAHIGGAFHCENGNFQAATLDLRDAWAASLHDSGLNDTGAGSSVDSLSTKWPQAGLLFLDGFVYGRISSEGQIDVDERIEWLKLQPELPFRQQPYLYLAKILRESGNSDGALHMLEKMEELRRSSEAHGFFSRLRSLLLKRSIGYGYYPGRAIWLIIFLSVMGWIVYGRSYYAGTMVPTDKGAYQDFKAEGVVPSHYPAFSPLVYSVENSLPLVKLGQADSWRPGPGPEGLSPISSLSRFGTSPRFVVWFLRIQILLGWLLATLFVAGVSGIVHKE